MLAARSQVRGQPIFLSSIDCCAKRTVWSCRQLQKLENKATQKQTGNHTHKETSDQSFEDASKASSHFGENDQNNVSRNKIHNPNNDNNISIIYKKNTHNGNNDNHKHRPNDNQNNLIMYNHARRADEMRRWYAQTGWGEEMRARDTSLPLQRQASKRGWTLAMRCGGSPRWTGCADQHGCAVERNRRHEQAR